MKRFSLEFTDEAKANIERSFRWGKHNWGSAKALKWYRELRANARDKLTRFPLGQPVAPESDELGHDVRHMIFGRYRLIFEVVGRAVRVLHLSGPFVERERRLLGESDE